MSFGNSPEGDSGDRMPVMAQELVDRLAEHKTLKGAPRSELEWLVARGTLRRLITGEALSVKGVQVELLHHSFRAARSVRRPRGRADQGR